jgi:FkbM family methyltransferase
MTLKENIVRIVRILTRQFPGLYATLGNIHHEFIFQKERLFLRLKYPSAIVVRYKKSTLKDIESKGFCSQYGQDYFLLKNRLIPAESGTFIDIGCNEPIHTSNTYYLEKKCSYKGIAIDPLNDHAESWRQDRPNSLFINAFVSDSATDVSFVRVSGDHGWEDKLSGAAESVNIHGKKVTTESSIVRPRRLKNILSESKFGFAADVLFVDVEGHELNVLKSADWSQGKPKVMVIENAGSLKTQKLLRSFITQKGYVLFARIDIADDVFVSE